MERYYDWFRDAKYGMMMHFGLYSLLGGEWKGRRSGAYAEWIQAHLAIPKAEYEQLAKRFDPTEFSADAVIRLARDCGMKYFVVTAKHHEGFALYDSAVDPFNSVKASPCRRDLILELREACAKYGLRFGFYYSQDLDWHEPNGGGYKTFTPCEGVSWDNSWDFADRSVKDYQQCYRDKILPQVTELLQNYGEISLVWFDTPMTVGAAQSRELYETVKRYQPNCLVNSRLGNGCYDYVSLGDNEYPETLAETTGDEDPNAIDGIKKSPLGLYETAGTVNDSWGYSVFDHNWKSPATVTALRERLNSLGINLLMNVGPDGSGKIPDACVDILRASATR